jgi:hypothetical protein
LETKIRIRILTRSNNVLPVLSFYPVLHGASEASRRTKATSRKISQWHINLTVYMGLRAAHTLPYTGRMSQKLMFSSELRSSPNTTVAYGAFVPAWMLIKSAFVPVA